MRMNASHEPWLPRLAWVALLGQHRLTVRVGTHVEVGDSWIAEAVWNGEFGQGDFDRTPAVFGSGIRVRDDHVTVVTSAGLVDRVWVHRGDEGIRVSNSLPVVLAAANDRLRDMMDYRSVHRNLPTDIGSPEPTLATDRGVVSVVYRNNLKLDGAGLRVVSKPPSTGEFSDFESYSEYLYGVAHGVGSNASADERRNSVSFLTAVSRGYDSPAVSALARAAGCRRAVTIRQARSTLPRDDSGEAIAAELGLDCQIVDRGGRGGPDELLFWAGDGRAGDQNLTAFDYPGEVTALFSGAFGGVIWADKEYKHPALADYPDRNMLSFCEYRLKQGVIHCPFPYLGYQHADDILRMMRSPEMEPWSVGGDYDRPIPRRIGEEAGIPRAMFGQRKNATQFEESFHWPYRNDLQRSYEEHLRRIGEEIPPIGRYRLLNAADRNFLLPLEERTPLSFQALRKRLRRPGRWLFNWANNSVADRLASSLEKPPEC